MKKLFLLFLSVATLSFAKADSGIWEYYAIITLNGSGTTYGNFGGGTSLNTDIGTISTTGGSLIAQMAGIKTWQNGGDDVTAAHAYYRVYKVGTTPGAFTTVVLPYLQPGPSAGDKEWQASSSLGVNLGNAVGYQNGDYILESYFRSTLANGEFRYESNGGANYISTFTVAIVQPVSLTNFEGAAQYNFVNLKWITSSEHNNKQFNIQRSANGTDFTTIGFVTGNGTTPVAHNYAYVDKMPLGGSNYYRLQQVDFDGHANYSNTIRVDVKGAGIKVAPSVTSGIVTVSGAELGSAIQIIDVRGRVAWQSKKSTGNTLDLTGLSSGTYFLSVIDAYGQRQTTKLVKQ